MSGLTMLFCVNDLTSSEVHFSIFSFATSCREPIRNSPAAHSPLRTRDGRSNDQLAARGESLASHRDGRGAPMARRDDGEYREYLTEEQRSQRGCIARRMQPDFHYGLLRRSQRSARLAEAVLG